MARSTIVVKITHISNRQLKVRPSLGKITVLWSSDGPLSAIQGLPISPRTEILGEALI